MGVLEDNGFKKLDKPYEFTCLKCGRTLKRETNIPTKACYCGARIVFDSQQPEKERES